MKNRFKINDKIVQYRHDLVIRKGTVVKGPFRVENVDHYHVVWDWECPHHAAVSPMFKQDVNLICDMKSTKYRYELYNQLIKFETGMGNTYMNPLIVNNFSKINH